MNEEIINANVESKSDIAIDATSHTPTKEKGFFSELLDTALLVLLVLLPIRLWVAQPFIVVGSSMDKTFSNGDYLIVDELSYRFHNPQREDVIVFRPPPQPNEHYIKRIIGLPGERLIVKDDVVKIINKDHPNGFILSEPYVSSERSTDLDITLNDGEYFVMGDNRAVSSDSRVWGPITKEEISGRTLIRLFPISSIDLWPGRYEEKIK